MAVQMLGIKTKFTDDQGRPLVGGKVHAYFAGTTTYQDTFKDPDMTIVNTNPIILDDSGSADVYLNGSYRIRIFDKNDVLIEEQDGVTQSASGEITTAKGEIIGLYGAVLNSLTNEVKRAVAAEKTITDSLTSETTRAKSAESALQSSISDETTRAKKAESNLNTGLAKEVSDRKLEVTRLDEVDAVLQAQINSVGGGKLAYKTYAEMIADKSNIAAKSSIDIIADSDDKNGTYLYDGANFVKSQYDLEKLIRAKVQNTFGTYAQMVASNLSDGAYALVADDIDDKNGIYIKQAESWIKSKYDPAKLAIDYAESKVGEFASLTNGKALLTLVDGKNNIYANIRNDGGLSLIGLSGTVQDSINNYNSKAYKIDAIDITSQSKSIYTVLDSKGEAVLNISSDSNVYVYGLDDSLQNSITKLNEKVSKTSSDIIGAKQDIEQLKIGTNSKQVFEKEFNNYKYVVSDSYADVISNHTRSYINIAPIPSCLAQQDYSIGSSWVSQVKAELTKAEDRVVIDGYDPTLRNDIGVVHPYAIEFAEKVAGYKYWLGITPYTNGNENIEIPFIYGSNDLDSKEWELIPSFPQPFEADPIDEDGSNRGHLSDPAFTYDPTTGDLVFFWRRSLYYAADSGKQNKCGIRASKFDGKKWSDNFDIMPMQPDDIRLLSPAITYNPSNKLFYLYTVSSVAGKANALVYRTSNTLHNATWSAPQQCTMIGNPDFFWHTEVKCIGDKVVALFHLDEQSATKGTYDGFYFAVSDDFVTFNCSPTSVATNGKLNLYKATFIPHINQDLTASFTLLYTNDHWESPSYRLFSTKTNTVNLGV